MLQRVNENGEIVCEHCGKPIVNKRDCIAHHKEPLTLDNVHDCTISLNPENVSLVHFRCHNEIHDRYGTYTRHVYLVYGCPLSGKETFVKERAGIHDIKINIDDIYECISNNPRYIKSGRLYDVAQKVRDAQLDCIKYKVGKWVNAWIIGGYPYKGERDRLCVEYGAEPILIECDKETALQRLATTPNGRDIKEYSKYIQTWFDRYSE